MTIVEAVATIDDLTHRLAQDKELMQTSNTRSIEHLFGRVVP